MACFSYTLPINTQHVQSFIYGYFKYAAYRVIEDVSYIRFPTDRFLVRFQIARDLFTFHNVNKSVLCIDLLPSFSNSSLTWDDLWNFLTSESA